MLRSTLIYNNFPMMFHWVKDLTRKGNFCVWAPGVRVFIWLKPQNTLQFNREKSLLQRRNVGGFVFILHISHAWQGSHVSSRNSTFPQYSWHVEFELWTINRQSIGKMSWGKARVEVENVFHVHIYQTTYKMNCSHRVFSVYIWVRNISTPSDQYWEVSGCERRRNYE